MNHLRAGWRLAASSRSSARLQHFFLPEDPVEAHRAIVGLAGHTAARRRALERWAAEVSAYDHARLADIAAKGGFSHHPVHGQAPSTGWMASYEAPEGSGVGQVHHIHELTAHHIAGHREAVHAHLQNPNSFQGGWHDTETGHVYLDASKHFNHENEAKDFAVHQRQKAIFHLDDFSERFIDPHQDPLRESDHGAWQQRYGAKTAPHPGWHSYGPKMYPDSDEQAAARGPQEKSASKMAGRVVHPGQNYPTTHGLPWRWGR